MIIQVRGTSGSGKSTVMRRVMEAMGTWDSFLLDGRKRPLYYRVCSEEGWMDTVVLGHYESPCGGGDTIGSAAQIHREIVAHRACGRSVVLVEGLLLSEDTKWTSTLPLDELRVIFLTTPLEECLTRIKGRRETAGNAKPLNPANTENRVAVVERARVKLIDAGVYCRRCSSAQAPAIILDLIRKAK